MIKTIGTPEGTRDRLFSECSLARQVRSRAIQAFRTHGYSELTTPNVEYYDVITATGHPLSQESMLKIIDRTGKILVMRPDNTVAIGRVAATKLHALPLPLRLYYDQTVFRSDDINTGARSELEQCGVELLGAAGVKADLEVIALAIYVMEACGLRDYHVEIGHAGYFSSLLNKLSMSEEEKETLRDLVEKKDFVSYSKHLSRYGDREEGKALLALPRLFGGPEVLERARAVCKDPEALEAVDYLQSLYQVLDAAGLSDRVRFDLGLFQSIEYYTGMMFRGYGQGAGSSVLSGGRYDKLIGHFGKDMPATGFSLDVSAVTDCLPKMEHQKPTTLIYYSLSSMGNALDALRGEPKGTAMLSCSEDLAQAREEGRTIGAEKLMIFDETGVKEEWL